MAKAIKRIKTGGPDPERRPYAVLIVDDEPDIRACLEAALGQRQLVFHGAGSLAEARHAMACHAIDLALVDMKLPDGSGLDLAAELKLRHPAVESIIITGDPTLPRAMDAVRIGAADFLAKPLNLPELNGSVSRAITRRREELLRHQRGLRMKRLCRKLNQARHEVTQQVDILCNDLVTAYQELVDQMRHIELTSEFKAILSQELDLEELLRKVLEFILHKVGPTNAVVFLPSQAGGYSVGGYINYNCDKGQIDMVLDHLSDLCASRISQETRVLHLTDDASISEWLERDDASWLEDRHVVATPCRHEGEVLAGLLLFRSCAEPYNVAMVDALVPLSELFAQHLVKVINVHHRHLDMMDDDDLDDDEDGGVTA